jgi:hypothetical protein
MSNNLNEFQLSKHFRPTKFSFYLFLLAKFHKRIICISFEKILKICFIDYIKCFMLKLLKDKKLCYFFCFVFFSIFSIWEHVFWITGWNFCGICCQSGNMENFWGKLKYVKWKKQHIFGFYISKNLQNFN